MVLEGVVVVVEAGKVVVRRGESNSYKQDVFGVYLIRSIIKLCGCI